MNSASDILNLQYPQNMEYIKDIWDLSICKRSNITRHLNFFTSLLATRYRIVSPLSPRYWKERLNSHKSEIKRKKSSWSAGDPIKRRPATTPQCWLLPHDVSQMSPCHLDRAWEDVLLPFTETATCYETPNEETDDRTKAMSKTHTIYKDKTDTKQRGIFQYAVSKKYCNTRGTQKDANSK